MTKNLHLARRLASGDVQAANVIRGVPVFRQSRELRMTLLDEGANAFHEIVL